MRITALLGMAALAASAITASAQVYSLNIVGYYNVTVKGNAYTMIANQLNAGGNTLKEVIPSAPDGSLVLKFVNNDYNTDYYDVASSAWFDANSGNPSTTTVAPGEGFFFNNSAVANQTITFVGEVITGTTSLSFPPNYKLASTKTPQALPLTTASGFPEVDSLLYLVYDNSINDYVTSYYDITAHGWFDANSGNPVTIAPAVGQGYFINNPNTSAITWTTTLNP